MQTSNIDMMITENTSEIVLHNPLTLSSLQSNFKPLTLVINRDISRKDLLTDFTKEKETLTNIKLTESHSEICNVNEEWKSLDILGYSNYEISSYGRV